MDDDADVYVIRVKPGPTDRELYYTDRNKNGEPGVYFTYVPDKASRYRTKTLAKMEAPGDTSKYEVVTLEDAKLAYIRRKIIDG